MTSFSARNRFQTDSLEVEPFSSLFSPLKLLPDPSAVRLKTEYTLTYRLRNPSKWNRETGVNRLTRRIFSYNELVMSWALAARQVAKTKELAVYYWSLFRLGAWVLFNGLFYVLSPVTDSLLFSSLLEQSVQIVSLGCWFVGFYASGCTRSQVSVSRS
jgi:hypothetical protein